MTTTLRHLDAQDESMRRQAAQMLVDAFRENWPEAWPTLEDALEEIAQALAPEKIARVLLDAQGDVVGWIGGIPTYDGTVWELHPLVVAPTHQGRGYGRLLVEDLEREVALRGGLILWLGSDDEAGMTTVSGIDLFPDPLAHLARIQNLKQHPYTFYQKCGFAFTGIVPDANGWGKPDLLMAKRVSPSGPAAG